MIGIQQLPLTGKHSIPFHTPVSVTRCQYKPIIKPEFITKNKDRFWSSSTGPVRAGWFLGLGEKKKVTDLPEIVQAGDPVLNEPARDVRPDEIGSERVQKIIDDMVKVMRGAPGVGLAAPQIGIPLKVIINPNLQKKGNKSALFFEGCLSVDGYRAMVERFLDVEVTGLDRYGQPIKVSASGWQARILQHECDHLAGTLYVDKMVKRTFRTVENLQLPLANGCPKPGVR
ncbi:putative peptide deformylase [Helianthus annuus]|nr:putative peptide deformylase [Helianthus annuus]KAJ0697388.1 putative peptide deformylase [Helianthus annuus]